MRFPTAVFFPRHHDTNHGIFAILPARKSRRKSRNRLKKTETRRGTLRGRSFR